MMGADGKRDRIMGVIEGGCVPLDVLLDDLQRLVRATNGFRLTRMIFPQRIQNT